MLPRARLCARDRSLSRAEHYRPVAAGAPVCSSGRCAALSAQPSAAVPPAGGGGGARSCSAAHRQLLSTRVVSCHALMHATDAQDASSSKGDPARGSGSSTGSATGSTTGVGSAAGSATTRQGPIYDHLHSTLYVTESDYGSMLSRCPFVSELDVERHVAPAVVSKGWWWWVELRPDASRERG